MVITALVLGLSAVLTIFANEIESSNQQNVRKHQPMIHNSYQLQIAVIQVQQWLTDISATRGLDGLNDGFDEAEKSFFIAKKALSNLVKLDPENSTSYQAMIPKLETYYTTGKSMAQSYIDKGPAGGNQLMASFDSTAESLTEGMESLISLIQVNAEAGAYKQSTAIGSIQTATAWISIGLFITTILLGLFIFRVIIGPINHLSLMVQNLAQGEGDLTQRIDANGKDELSELAQAINAFVARVDIMVSQMTHSIIRLIPMANELSDTNQQISESSKEHRSQSQKVGASMQQAMISAKEVADLVTQISNSAEGSVNMLDTGQQVAQETIGGMDQLSQELSSANDAILVLKSDSESIESVISTINSISEQTNLLALNAAIEAARAGEAGRGFAVVADEVRNLASRTKDSTHQVQSMIQSIQQKTLSVSDAMDKGMQSTASNIELVNKTSCALKDVGQLITEINQSSTLISSATQLQNDSFQSVLENVHTMEEHSESSFCDLENNFNFGTDLNKLSAKLQGMVSSFRVTDTGWSDQVRDKIRVKEKE